DRLTQLQEAMDELLEMFLSAFFWVERHHDLKTFGPNDKIPDLKADQPKEVDTKSPEEYKAGQLQLARDIIVKEQQIEYLISTLPGLDNSEREQIQLLRELEDDLVTAEAQRQEALKERDEVLGKLDALLRGLERP
nr:Chain U, Mediator of RNA polymerase II transcription subunit 21 [Thermochaetoides thermophila DSM 1495]